MSDPPDLASLLQEYLERRRRGEEVSPEELCAGRPELLEALRGRVEELLALGEGGERALLHGPWATVPAPPTEVLSPRVERLCNEFENAWTVGPPPRIEDFLARGEGGERAAL